MQRRLATFVASETDLLCESCGYILNGLPGDSRCPECGAAVVDSGANNPRRPFRMPLLPLGFVGVARDVLFRPTRFFRSLQTRQPVRPARYFAWCFYFITALLAQQAYAIHLRWMTGTNQLSALSAWFNRTLTADARWQAILAVTLFGVLMPLAMFLLLEGVSRLAARLTAWEAAYRGLRMPYPAVLRAIYFHSVHYLPVAMFVFTTIFGYDLALRRQWIQADTAEAYLYALCGEVIAGAIYLFWTYWIAMRNIMYANR